MAQQRLDSAEAMKRFQIFVISKQDAWAKDITFMQKQIGMISADLNNTNVYLNKILPMKTYSSMVNMMHGVLNSKEDLTNLKLYTEV